MNLGDLLKYEAPNLYSRDRVTVVAGQNLPLGAVVGIVTARARYKQIDPSARTARRSPLACCCRARRHPGRP
jgi:hypothetical protein